MIVKRMLFQDLLDALNLHKVIILLGSRQVGKTTLVKEILSQQKDGIYLSLDDIAFLRRLEENPASLKSILEEEFKMPFQNIPAGSLIVVDECQKVPQLLDQIKFLYDANPAHFRWMLTGSSALELRSRSAETLAGRSLTYQLSPFSWKEILNYREKIESKNQQTESFLSLLLSGNLQENEIKKVILPHAHQKEIWLKWIDELLVFGSFPEIMLTEDPALKWRLLENYHKTYLEKDVLQWAQIADWKGFAHLLEVSASLNNSPIRISNLSEQTGLARDTVKKYLSILEKSFLFYEIPVFSRRVKQKILKSSKYEWMDTGLVSVLTRATDFATLQATGAIGTRLESWAISQLKFATENLPLASRLYFWRTVSQDEVDVILEHEGKLYPIEIKYSNKVRTEDLKGLRRFSEERKKEIGAKFLFYRGEYYFNSAEQVHYIPVWALF